jgi:hypothetical protein
MVLATAFAVAWSPCAKPQAISTQLMSPGAVRSCLGALHVTAYAAPGAFELSAGESDLVLGPLPPIVPLLGTIELSEAQQDAVFEILHRHSPAVRQSAKELRNAYASLARLAVSSDYSFSELSKLSEAIGAAAAQSAKVQAELEHEIGTVLTPEQRHVIEEARRDGLVDLPHGNCLLRSLPSGPAAR